MIQLTDKLGLDATVAPSDASAFAKYVAGKEPIEAVLENTGERSADLSFKEPVTFGTGGPKLTINPKITAKLVNSDDPSGQACVALTVQTLLDLGVSATSGDLQFGFHDQTQVSITNSRLYPHGGQIAAVAQSLLQNFTIPGDLADIDSLPAGAVASLDGTGALKFTVEADLPVGVNPLATVTETLLNGALAIKAGGAASIKAAYTITGEYQIRIQRLAARQFQLEFKKASGQELDVSVETDAGLDLQQSLLQASSPVPLPPDTIVSADEKAALNAAVKAGVDHSLKISLTAELDLLRNDSAAFSYQVDAAVLNGAGRQAVLNALRGDLSALEAHAPAGVKPLHSVFDHMRQREAVLKINLLGIFSIASVASLARDSTATVDPDTGAVTFADKATASQVGLSTGGMNLRKILAESLLITAAYRTSGAIATAEVGASQWFYELHKTTALADLRHCLNIVRALRLASPADPGDPGPFGRSQFLVESKYSDALFRNMFLDSAGAARRLTDYDNMGRSAMLALLPAGSDLANARRLPLTDAALWSLMRTNGQPNNFGGAFAGYGFSDNELADIDADYTLIVGWSGAMNKMAAALIKKSPLDQLRVSLRDAMASVAGSAKNEFAEPFGLLALDLATGQRAEVTARLACPKFSFTAARTTS